MCVGGGGGGGVYFEFIGPYCNDSGHAFEDIICVGGAEVGGVEAP